MRKSVGHSAARWERLRKMLSGVTMSDVLVEMDEEEDAGSVRSGKLNRRLQNRSGASFRACLEAS